MGCASCGTAEKDGVAQGCNNNGGCSSGGCNKMNVFDWLSNMDAPIASDFDIVEVRFKNGRKDFYRNTEKLDLTTGDAVVVDVPNGHHMGHVSLQGELVRLQMKKRNVPDDQEIKSIYRIAAQRDIDKYRDVKKRELPTLYRTRKVIEELELKMKLTDVEYQADNVKATFYYSADERVDFRELIKRLAAEFRIRVEMRQISMRQEAGRLGGIGSCGRELCCSTWLGDFKSVSTQAARYQNLSLNPSKLSGQCGRLKCCLNYELDTYIDALKDIPKVERPLETEQGRAKLQKTDIFKKIMWFGYDGDTAWYPLDVPRVNEILALNKKGEKPVTLAEDVIEVPSEDVGLNSDLVAMDRKFNKGKDSNKRKKNKKRNWKKNKPKGESAEAKKPQGEQASKPKASKPNRPKRRKPNKPKKEE